MTADSFGAIVHNFAPHGSKSLYLVDLFTVLIALCAVYTRCRFTGSHRHLQSNWIVTVATITAPIPTFVLLLILPLDQDLGSTVFQDPVVVALAGMFGIVSAFRDLRAMASRARKREMGGEDPTDQ